MKKGWGQATGWGQCFESLQCFDAVSWVTGRTTHATYDTYLEKFSSGKIGERKPCGLANWDSPRKWQSKLRMGIPGNSYSWIGNKISQVPFESRTVEPSLGLCPPYDLLLWSPYGIGQTIKFSSCRLFFLLSIFFPCLISAAADWYFHTWCGLSANLRRRSETCCMRLAENTGRKKVAKNRHLGTIAQLCRAISSQLRHVSTIGKSLLSSNMSSICPHNMVNFGPIATEIDPVVWGSPLQISTGFASWRLVVGVSQTLRHWTEGATYVRQGDHHVGHWPTY